MPSTQRRAKGSGSIRKRGEDRWEIRYDGPPGQDRESKKVYETIKGSRRQADKALRERLAAVDHGVFVQKKTDTVSDLIDEWLAVYVIPNCKPRTQQNYRVAMNSYIRPTLGNVRLQALTPQQIQKVYSDLFERGLQASTVTQICKIFRQALNHAVRKFVF